MGKDKFAKITLLAALFCSSVWLGACQGDRFTRDCEKQEESSLLCRASRALVGPSLKEILAPLGGRVTLDAEARGEERRIMIEEFCAGHYQYAKQEPKKHNPAPLHNLGVMCEFAAAQGLIEKSEKTGEKE